MAPWSAVLRRILKSSPGLAGVLGLIGSVRPGCGQGKPATPLPPSAASTAGSPLTTAPSSPIILVTRVCPATRLSLVSVQSGAWPAGGALQTWVSDGLGLCTEAQTRTHALTRTCALAHTRACLSFPPLRSLLRCTSAL